MGNDIKKALLLFRNILEVSLEGCAAGPHTKGYNLFTVYHNITWGTTINMNGEKNKQQDPRLLCLLTYQIVYVIYILLYMQKV